MATILAVDDSTSMRQMVAFTLKGAGFDVVEAADGKEALGAAQKTKFDLVLSDVNMPVMDGITLVKELRALPSYKFTPILMLTTESAGSKKSEGKQAGATGWIVKPFNPDQLLSTIKKYWGNELWDLICPNFFRLSMRRVLKDSKLWRRVCWIWMLDRQITN